jgi:HEAT repeat protein
MSRDPLTPQFADITAEVGRIASDALALMARRQLLAALGGAPDPAEEEATRRLLADALDLLAKAARAETAAEWLERIGRRRVLH